MTNPIFYKLPHTLLAKIVSFIELNIDRIAFTLVCKGWFDNREKYLVLHTKQFISFDAEYNNTFLKSYNKFIIQSNNSAHYNSICVTSISQPKHALHRYLFHKNNNNNEVNNNSSNSNNYSNIDKGGLIAFKDQVEHLYFTDHYREHIDDGFMRSVGLSNITTIYFSKLFNQPIQPNFFPRTIEKLVFGEKFNQPLTVGCFPVGLKTLEFGKDFNQLIDTSGILPDNLESIIFGAGLTRLSLKGLPPKLKLLRFSQSDLGHYTSIVDYHQDNSLESLVRLENLPDNHASKIKWINFKSLQYFSMSYCAGEMIMGYVKESVAFPLTITTLDLRMCSTTMIFNVDSSIVLPPNLKKLFLPRGWTYSLKILAFPDGLTMLHMGYSYNLPLKSKYFPQSLKKLEIPFMFNQKLNEKSLPRHLESITFGENFNQKLKPKVIPKTVRKLTFNCSFEKYPLLSSAFPPGLTKLSFNPNAPLKVKPGVIVESVNILTFRDCFFAKQIKSIPQTVQTIILYHKNKTYYLKRISPSNYLLLIELKSVIESGGILVETIIISFSHLNTGNNSNSSSSSIPTRWDVLEMLNHLISPLKCLQCEPYNNNNSNNHSSLDIYCFKIILSSRDYNQFNDRLLSNSNITFKGSKNRYQFTLKERVSSTTTTTATTKKTTTTTRTVSISNLPTAWFTIDSCRPSERGYPSTATIEQTFSYFGVIDNIEIIVESEQQHLRAMIIVNNNNNNIQQEDLDIDDSTLDTLLYFQVVIGFQSIDSSVSCYETLSNYTMFNVRNGENYVVAPHPVEINYHDDSFFSEVAMRRRRFQREQIHLNLKLRLEAKQKEKERRAANEEAARLRKREEHEKRQRERLRRELEEKERRAREEELENRKLLEKLLRREAKERQRQEELENKRLQQLEEAEQQLQQQKQVELELLEKIAIKQQIEREQQQQQQQVEEEIRVIDEDKDKSLTIKEQSIIRLNQLREWLKKAQDFCPNQFLMEWQLPTNQKQYQYYIDRESQLLSNHTDNQTIHIPCKAIPTDAYLKKWSTNKQQHTDNKDTDAS
ncbi:hypothetical protein PPL_01929 [Heterostelium album PN500]|uniref:F-box domain-containing protein n=1 Tax=Heterostelium pallidum (strain ATCC 26659 / Pp 5 / PN500) TaxID=670386 RepID=D3B0W2_HETP5|nr:hypothetical protein PPL_01929 [Heterostelium album PN500]EFA84936.1 hypothetical protein PPL_01929 [Heterostelium album PN500]|eukprot:XP_020437046.1 hypothetical protein PPL_01929 [Heterostelium album PN500]